MLKALVELLAFLNSPLPLTVRLPPVVLEVGGVAPVPQVKLEPLSTIEVIDAETEFLNHDVPPFMDR